MIFFINWLVNFVMCFCNVLLLYIEFFNRVFCGVLFVKKRMREWYSIRNVRLGNFCVMFFGFEMFLRCLVKFLKSLMLNCFMFLSFGNFWFLMLCEIMGVMEGFLVKILIMFWIVFLRIFGVMGLLFRVLCRVWLMRVVWYW